MDRISENRRGAYENPGIPPAPDRLGILMRLFFFLQDSRSSPQVFGKRQSRRSAQRHQPVGIFGAHLLQAGKDAFVVLVKVLNAANNVHDAAHGFAILDSNTRRTGWHTCGGCVRPGRILGRNNAFKTPVNWDWSTAAGQVLAREDYFSDSQFLFPCRPVLLGALCCGSPRPETQAQFCNPSADASNAKFKDKRNMDMPYALINGSPL